jgi:hypothetical protein
MKNNCHQVKIKERQLCGALPKNKQNKSKKKTKTNSSKKGRKKGNVENIFLFMNLMRLLHE